MSAPALTTSSSWTELRSLPVWAHALGLGAVLFALLPVVGTSASFSSDEGAYIHQARAVSEDGTWVIPHPLPGADPDGSAFPLALAARADDGFVAVARQPVYTSLLAAADRLAGGTGMFAISILGTVGAAVAGALIARRLAPGLETPTLWVLGIASPLFFDAYLVLAHTVGAALGGFLVLCALAGRGPLRVAPLTGAAVCAAGVVMVRREGLLLVAAVVVVTAVEGMLRRRALSWLVPGSIAAGAAAGWLVGRLARPSTRGEAWEGLEPAVTTLGGRLPAARTTWLDPGYAPFDRSDVLVTILLVLGVALVVTVRLRRSDVSAHVALALAVVMTSVVLVVLLPTDPIPGLLATCPVVLYGLLALRRPRGETAVVLAIAAAFCVAVFLTQYDRGGSLEWGGRYFAIGLPALVPAMLVGLRAVLRSLGATSRRSVLAALFASSLALAVVAVSTLRDSHDDAERLVAGAVQLGGRVESGDGGDPVIVTTDPDLGRLAWPVAEQSRWLYSRDQDVAGLLEGISSAGVDHAVLVTGDPTVAEGLERSGLVIVLEEQSTVGGEQSLLELRRVGADG